MPKIRGAPSIQKAIYATLRQMALTKVYMFHKQASIKLQIFYEFQWLTASTGTKVEENSEPLNLRTHFCLHETRNGWNAGTLSEPVQRRATACYLVFGSSNSVGLVGTLSDTGVSGKSKMATITGSTYGVTQYLSFYTTLQRNCYDSTLIVQANELNGTGVINVDVGYVCTSGNISHL